MSGGVQVQGDSSDIEEHEHSDGDCKSRNEKVVYMYYRSKVRYIHNLIDFGSWLYLINGIIGRFSVKVCPCCDSENTHAIDRKLVFTLEQCIDCGILFRYPYEDPSKLTSFYQNDYKQPGLTTDLPSKKELEEYMSRNFEGTEKDFTRVVNILRILGVNINASILDYGANWGYGVFQLRDEGYNAEGLEISIPRAQFANKIGIQIYTDISTINQKFDVIYSGHVLEHVSNPKSILEQQIQFLKDEGFVIAHTPNGSYDKRDIDSKGFHLSWGRVHPVLLSEEFIKKNFSEFHYFISSGIREKEIEFWQGKGQYVGPLDGEELLIIIKNN